MLGSVLAGGGGSIFPPTGTRSLSTVWPQTEICRLRNEVFETTAASSLPSYRRGVSSVEQLIVSELPLVDKQ